ncbi:DNA-binding XRE family transcriptional regulator [Fontibacillus solani]|uniref:DNA-binding XRE family transcriptional regulator n=1 Tax=Fontibacillus solani TaxID=1572857 RepID=A0A7W3SVF5_9BACL|nr:helix-turn-helix transcriptional regulator [Fontibacillus solani]MBA9086985.1 DNA-binding XRE family transcriptional regulator [Fontibacillus solani]
MTVSPKQARLLCEKTQREIAGILGVHRDTYMKWEKNPDVMPVGKAKEFASIVGRNVDEIFFSIMST